MINQDQSTWTWVSWLWWVVASAVGALIGVILAYTLIGAFGTFLGANLDQVATLLFLPIVGLGIATMQWLVMRQLFARAGWWLLASAVGIFVGFGLLTGVGYAAMALIGQERIANFTQGAFSLTVAFAFVGSGLGLAQWLFLRQKVTRAGWWVIASLLGWSLLGWTVGDTFTDLIELIEIGVVPALVTGAALVWLLRQPMPVETNEPAG